MPKSKPKTKANIKNKKKAKAVTEAKTPNITMHKSYWAFLASLAGVSTLVFGLVLNMSIEITLLLLATFLSIIGFISYLRFRPAIAGGSRGVFLFVGGCVVGFCFWAAIMLTSNATGFLAQMVNSTGNAFIYFTLIICWTAGAFIGDVVGRKRNYVFPHGPF